MGGFRKEPHGACGEGQRHGQVWHFPACRVFTVTARSMECVEPWTRKRTGMGGVCGAGGRLMSACRLVALACLVKSSAVLATLGSVDTVKADAVVFLKSTPQRQRPSY